MVRRSFVSPGLIPLFEKEGEGEIFQMIARRASQQIPLDRPFSKGEAIQLVRKSNAVRILDKHGKKGNLTPLSELVLFPYPLSGFQKPYSFHLRLSVSDISGEITVPSGG